MREQGAYPLYAICNTVWRDPSGMYFRDVSSSEHSKNYCPYCRHRILNLALNGCIHAGTRHLGNALDFEERK